MSSQYKMPAFIQNLADALVTTGKGLDKHQQRQLIVLVSREKLDELHLGRATSMLQVAIENRRELGAADQKSNGTSCILCSEH